MKTYLFLSILFLTLFSSCKKEKDEDETPVDELYISFKLDGVEKKYISNGTSLNSSSGGTNGISCYSSSGFFDQTKNIFIDFSIEKDSISGSDYEASVGQSFSVCESCPVSLGLRYEIDGEIYESRELKNPFPINFFKITSVSFYRLNNMFGQNTKEYYVTGEFTTKINKGNAVKNITEGKFRLVFQDFNE
jgi:hypothetical protein